MQPTVLESIRNKLYLLEKSLSVIRAEIEMSLTDDARNQADVRSEFVARAGLHNLLNSYSPIARKQVQSGQEFSPGVRINYDTKAEMECFAESISFSSEQAGDRSQGSSCLLVSSTFDKLNPPSYIALESVIDIDLLRKATAFKLLMVSGFQHELGSGIANFNIGLRLCFGNDYTDHFRKTYPSLNMPMSFHYDISPDSYAELPLSKATTALILIGLPRTESAYQFIVSAFNPVLTRG